MSHPAGQSGNSSTADTRTDPAMKALYHMSKTAGVGLGDYAEINVLSVIGLLVGFSSFLLLIFGDSSILLILPVAALVVCGIAILQIRNSNGTQAGLIWAAIGVALALIFGGINLTSRARLASEESASRKQIESLIARLGTSAATQSTIPSSYDLFHPRFQEIVKPDTFARTVALRTGLTSSLPIAKYGLGEHVLFETNPDTHVSQATAYIVLSSDRKDEQGNVLKAEIPAMFRRDPGGEWKFYSIPDWFGEEQKPTR